MLLARPRILTPLLALALAATLACGSDATPEAAGRWGGSAVSLVLTGAGGALTYQCGTGTIDSAWTVDEAGRFRGTGKHYFGGGPAPSGGRPPHPASYAGTIDGNVLILTVTLEEEGQRLGPFSLVRRGPEVRELCL